LTKDTVAGRRGCRSNSGRWSTRRKPLWKWPSIKTAIGWTAQTALRDVIGKTMLSEMLTGRENIDTDLQKIIDKRTESWGIQVLSVEIRDVLIPAALENAMSMQAQPNATASPVILGDSERQVAKSSKRPPGPTSITPRRCIFGP